MANFGSKITHPAMLEQKWVKGKSGNPGGVPKTVRHARIRAAAACPEAIETLVGVMRGPNTRDAIAACLAILERGLGKPGAMRELYPVQSAEAKAAKEIDLKELTDEQLDKIHAILVEGAS